MIILIINTLLMIDIERYGVLQKRFENLPRLRSIYAFSYAYEYSRYPQSISSKSVPRVPPGLKGCDYIYAWAPAG